MKQAYWLWYPGDFELYHAMLQNFSRVERGCEWPAFWKSGTFRPRVAFRREYTLERPARFTVYGTAGAKGYVQAGEEKHPLGEEICLPAGTHRISVHVACISSVPSIYVEGEEITSGDGWCADDFDADPVPAAYNRYFTDPGRDPSEWPLSERVYEPVLAENVNGGVLFTFETELTAALAFDRWVPRVFLGESRAEALDTEHCYYSCAPDRETLCCPRQAVRYAFVPGRTAEDLQVRAVHQYLDIPVQASFHSGDEELDRIFAVAAHTFMLCSGPFFLDGVKRDKWIWGGDAYQSLFVNRYLTADKEIEKRTLIALRGTEPTTTHVNTILDYSLLWILSVDAYYESYGDREFVDFLWPKMQSLMELVLSQREEHGFLIGRKRDWVYIDWADFDRDGPLCAEQMLLAESLRVMARFAPEEEKTGWIKTRERLLTAVEQCFWDSEKEAYVDSFTSGKRNVTRHANIFAILFDIADEERKKTLAESVLLNDAVPAITTPYFRFFELDALCRLGYLEEVLHTIRSYWGGMLKLGAVTFWEEYDPGRPLEEQYGMYGDPFGKSLCHAWAASPIYLLARYFAGLQAEVPGGETYRVTPAAQLLPNLDAAFPMGGKLVRIRLRDGVPVTE